MLQMKHFESQSRCGTVDVFNALSLTHANFMDLLTAWLRKQLCKKVNPRLVVSQMGQHHPNRRGGCGSSF